MFKRCAISFKECDEVEYPVLKFTVKCANSFFRCLRQHGIFIPEPDRSMAVDACFLMCETWFQVVSVSVCVHVLLRTQLHTRKLYECVLL